MSDLSVLQANSSHLEVDGMLRPTTTSEGRPIHPTVEGIRNFWRWFGDSKAVDAEDRPLVVYHGTGSDVSVFDNNTWRSRSAGFFFTTSPRYAGMYARTETNSWRERDQLRGNIMPAYLSATNPREMLGDEWKKIEHGSTPNMTVYWIFDQGFDSIVVRDFHDTPGHDTWIIKCPAQIKSATGNRGTFDPENAGITMSRRRPVARRLGFDLEGLLSTPVEPTVPLGHDAEEVKFLHRA